MKFLNENWERVSEKGREMLKSWTISRFKPFDIDKFELHGGNPEKLSLRKNKNGAYEKESSDCEKLLPVKK